MSENAHEVDLEERLRRGSWQILGYRTPDLRKRDGYPDLVEGMLAGSDAVHGVLWSNLVGKERADALSRGLRWLEEQFGRELTFGEYDKYARVMLELIGGPERAPVGFEALEKDLHLEEFGSAGLPRSYVVGKIKTLLQEYTIRISHGAVYDMLDLLEEGEGDYRVSLAWYGDVTMASLHHRTGENDVHKGRMLRVERPSVLIRRGDRVTRKIVDVSVLIYTEPSDPIRLFKEYGYTWSSSMVDVVDPNTL